MEGWLNTYSEQLNVLLQLYYKNVMPTVEKIESKNKDLQVETANQRLLLKQLDKILVCLIT